MLGVALVALLVAALAATVAVRPLMSTGTDRHKADPGGGPPPRSTASADVNPPLPAPSGTPEHRPLGRRIGALAMITVVSAAGVVAVTARNARRLEVAARSSSAHLAATQRLAHPGQAQQQPSLLSASLAGLLARPHLLVLDTTEGNSFERLEVADANNPTGPRALTPLECWRVDERAGRGICLTGDRVQATQAVTVFDNTFKVLFTIPVEGTPSRTRVAPNGQIGAATTFVAGDAYNVDNFSTHTVLVDLSSGRIIADLEHFTITKGGHAFHPIDENFWGVTFAADSDTFYATMRTGSHYYLIRGHARTRRGEILRDGVECPSISPDGTLLVYKSRIDHGFDPATWELHVLVLANLADHPLAETRNVDDQAAWADNTHVVYGIASTLPGNGTTDTWTVPADGTGTPTLLVPAGESPVPAPAEGP